VEQEIKNLLHSVVQLCSDVESSTSGKNGAHKIAIERVRKNMRAVEAVSRGVKTTALQDLCKARCYFCRMGDEPVLVPQNGVYFHSDSFAEGPETGSWPFTCAAADIRRGHAAGGA
jgi:hypothetical protein